MRSYLHLAALFALFGMAGASFGADAKDEKKDDKKPAEKKEEKKPAAKSDTKDTRKWIKLAPFQTTLSRIDAAQKMLAIQVPETYVGNNLRLAVRMVDAEVAAADDLKVRQLNPPVEFDLKGRPKKYTSKELRELKGPGNLPGYPADFEALKAGQFVQVWLKKPKPLPRYRRDKDAAVEDDKPVVDMVVIIREKK